MKIMYRKQIASYQNSSINITFTLVRCLLSTSHQNAWQVIDAITPYIRDNSSASFRIKSANLPIVCATIEATAPGLGISDIGVRKITAFLNCAAQIDSTSTTQKRIAQAREILSTSSLKKDGIIDNMLKIFRKNDYFQVIPRQQNLNNLSERG